MSLVRNSDRQTEEWVCGDFLTKIIIVKKILMRKKFVCIHHCEQRRHTQVESHITPNTQGFYDHLVNDLCKLEFVGQCLNIPNLHSTVS